MKIIGFLLVCCCLFLGYDIYYGHNGIRQYNLVERQLKTAREQTMSLQKKNQDVLDQITELQQGDIAVEELARSELGLIKPGERFYRVLAPEEMQTVQPARLHIN